MCIIKRRTNVEKMKRLYTVYESGVLVSLVWICRLGLYLLDLLVKGNITLIYEIIFSGFFSLVVYFCIDSLFFLFIKYEVIEDTH